MEGINAIYLEVSDKMLLTCGPEAKLIHRNKDHFEIEKYCNFNL